VEVVFNLDNTRINFGIAYGGRFFCNKFKSSLKLRFSGLSEAITEAIPARPSVQGISTLKFIDSMCTQKNLNNRSLIK